MFISIMILNAFGEVAAGGGESFPLEREGNSGSADIHIGLFTGLSEPAVVHLALY